MNIGSITSAVSPRVAAGATARPAAPGFGIVLYGTTGAGDVVIPKVPVVGTGSDPVATGSAPAVPVPGTSDPLVLAEDVPSIDPVRQPEPIAFGDDAMPDLGDALPTIDGPTPVFLPTGAVTSTLDPSAQPSVRDDGCADISTRFAARRAVAASGRQDVAANGTTLPAPTSDEEVQGEAAPVRATTKLRLEPAAWPPHIFVVDPSSPGPAKGGTSALAPSTELTETIAAPASSADTSRQPATSITDAIPAALPAGTPRETTVSMAIAIPFAAPDANPSLQGAAPITPASASEGATIPATQATTITISDPGIAGPGATTNGRANEMVLDASTPPPASVAASARSFLANASAPASLVVASTQTGALLAASAVARMSATKDAKVDAGPSTAASLPFDPTLLALQTAQPTSAPDQSVALTPTLDTRDPTWTASLAARVIAAQDGATGAGGRIRLSPDALGRVDVSIRSIAGKLHVTLNAETEGARQLLAAAQPELVALAAQRGTTIASAEVTGGDPTRDRAQADDRRGSDQPSSQPDRRNRFFGSSPADPTTTFASLTERLA